MTVMIASEPSNPWVTGVEMLFSREFLEAARDRLAPGGVYAQWFHTYETDTATVELDLGDVVRIDGIRGLLKRGEAPIMAAKRWSWMGSSIGWIAYWPLARTRSSWMARWPRSTVGRSPRP